MTYLKLSNIEDKEERERAMPVLVEARKAKQLSQEKLAFAIGCSTASIRAGEHGLKIPSEKLFRVWAAHLDLTVVQRTRAGSSNLAFKEGRKRAVEILVQARKSQELPQKFIAEALNVITVVVSQFETGKRIPSEDLVLAWAERLNVELT